MFDRFELLIGKDALEKIKKSKILIVGIGGVGGSVATSLIRSGVQNIVLIDFDTVDITNLNRQIVAYHSTIGLKKVNVMKKLLLDINPSIVVKTYEIFVDKDNIKTILDEEKRKKFRLFCKIAEKSFYLQNSARCDIIF